jgi:hypothetical protein
MIAGMDLERVSRYLFILYCTTIGVALLYLPWSPGWDRLVLQLPWGGLRWLSAPAARGAITGFGMVHLVWSMHELREFLRPGPDERFIESFGDGRGQNHGGSLGGSHGEPPADPQP